jgi:hypothetical protein
MMLDMMIIYDGIVLRVSLSVIGVDLGVSELCNMLSVPVDCKSLLEGFGARGAK